MIPHERSLVTKFKDKPVVILGVNSDDTPENFRRQMKEHDVTWPSFFDGGGTGGPIATRWGVTGWPTLYVIDQQGIIRHADADGDFLETAVQALLGENAEKSK